MQRMYLPVCQKKKVNMKHTVVILVLLFAAACRQTSLTSSPVAKGTQTGRDTLYSNDTLVTGTLVEDPGCGHMIVEVLGGPIPDSSVLAKSWTDSVSHQTFTNVFMVKNFWTMQQAQVQQGDTFTFRLNDPSTDDTVYYTCNIVPYNLPPAGNCVWNIQLVH
jgi:hypothetical protein